MIDILYVEDEPSVRENYSEVLEEAGYGVIACGTCADANSALMNGPVRLYVLDVALGSNCEGGYLLSREIRTQDPTAKIIFLTTNTDERDRARSFEEGACAHIGKDEPISTLVESIHQVLHSD